MLLYEGRTLTPDEYGWLLDQTPERQEEAIRTVKIYGGDITRKGPNHD